ncbi:MAG: DUF3857 domain-containing protein [Bacteroidia bacterium]|nr:DUF3857 domain-containing protein [Bacteroidia bacterium]
MNCLLLIIALALSTPGVGDEPKYPVSAIPAELKEGANVVVREDAIVCKVLSPDKVLSKVRMVATIFNGKGKSYAKPAIGYDKHRKIVSMHAAVYDPSGKVIRKLKNNEITDQSQFDGFSLYSDNRMKYFDLTQATYPYTIEIEYEMEYKSAMYLSGSYVYAEENVSVEKWSYQIEYRNDAAPRLKLINLDLVPQTEKTSDGLTVMKWTLENVKPIKFEPHGPPEDELTPYIKAEPSKFSFDGYDGDMSTWRDYGKWQITLNEGRSELPEETKAKVRTLTKSLTSDEDK